MKDWIIKVFSEGGEASFGRVASFICIVSCLVWDSATLTFIFTHWSQLHPQISDLWVPAATLAGQGAFCLLFYGTNKIKAGIDSSRPDNGQTK